MAKRKKTKKISIDYSKKPLFDLEDQTKKAILAILFFSFAIIILLSIWHKAGPFGGWFSGVLIIYLDGVILSCRWYF